MIIIIIINSKQRLEHTNKEEMFMDILFIAALFIISPSNYSESSKEAFDPDCGGCSGGCGCCSANSMSENPLL